MPSGFEITRGLQTSSLVFHTTNYYDCLLNLKNSTGNKQNGLVLTDGVRTGACLRQPWLYSLFVFVIVFIFKANHMK